MSRNISLQEAVYALSVENNVECLATTPDINCSFEEIIWNGQTPMDKNTVIAKQQELQTAENNKQYQYDRQFAYPSIQEQLDMQYHDAVNGTTTWKDAIAQVKADYPKSE